MGNVPSSLTPARHSKTASAGLPVVLIADDEPDVLELVASNLRNAGFGTLTATEGSVVPDLAARHSPALIILDLMLPGLTGLEACKVLKSNPLTGTIPIVMLTAKAEEIDRVLGLELGADDYVTKPFSPRELVLRVKSILRRGGREKGSVEESVGDLIVSSVRHEVTVKGKPVELTATEFKLLSTLVERRGRVQSRERLLTDVWGYETSIDTRTIDTHLRRLREKLGPAADYIETIRGFGYRLRYKG